MFDNGCITHMEGKQKIVWCSNINVYESIITPHFILLADAPAAIHCKSMFFISK